MTISDSENVINHMNDVVQPMIEVDEVKAEVESNHEALEQVLVEPEIEIEIEEVLQYQEEPEAPMKQKLRLKWKNQLLNFRKSH